MSFLHIDFFNFGTSLSDLEQTYYCLSCVNKRRGHSPTTSIPRLSLNLGTPETFSRYSRTHLLLSLRVRVDRPLFFFSTSLPHSSSTLSPRETIPQHPRTYCCLVCLNRLLLTTSLPASSLFLGLVETFSQHLNTLTTVLFASKSHCKSSSPRQACPVQR